MIRGAAGTACALGIGVIVQRAKGSKAGGRRSPILVSAGVGCGGALLGGAALKMVLIVTG